MAVCVGFFADPALGTQRVLCPGKEMSDWAALPLWISWPFGNDEKLALYCETRKTDEFGN